MNSFSERIKRLREGRGLTQSQLGAKLGVTSVAVSRWEGGLNLPKSSRLLQLAEFFIVDPTWLKTGVQKMGMKQFVDIPFYSGVSASAGAGCFCSEEYIDGAISINKESLSKASSLKNLVCINIRGVSMEPV
ncbi:MAG: helix-turn-helix domain-containing protein, partial [Shewanella sp.]